MKVLTVFLAIVVLLTLTACGDSFDAEAEKEAVAAVSKKIDDDQAIADREATLAAFHDDLTLFFSYPPDNWNSWTRREIGPDWFIEPWAAWWEDYEVLVSTDLAVIKGERNDQDGTRGFGTAVFTKEDGQWRLIHYHGSYAGP
jgi:hypothetical protein